VSAWAKKGNRLAVHLALTSAYGCAPRHTRREGESKMTQPGEHEDRFVVNPSVVFRELDGETVLLNLDSGVYFGLDTVGTRVWTLLLEHGTTGPVCAQMEREYDVEREELERDVQRLVRELRQKGLLVAAGP
jgi:hypothetical protein